MKGLNYIAHFIENDSELFQSFKNNITWDTRMATRKTASFGKAYNYSLINYPYQEFTIKLKRIIKLINCELGFKPNNCLINYYLDGSSKMGFHSDQTDILYKNTGIGILSLGETRILRFRSIQNKEEVKDFKLASGSFIYMTNEIQEKWQHSIPKSNTENGRMSLTFRKIK